MKKIPGVSEKNKKNEILDAYHIALEELKEHKERKPKEEKQKREEARVTEQASLLSFEGIVKNLANVKLQVGKSLEELGEQLTERYREYTDLLCGIEAQKRTLQELHDITVESDTFLALVNSQKKLRQEFENETATAQSEFDEAMEALKKDWEIEKKNYEWNWKEKLKQQETERKREGEDYSYQLKVSRQKDKDQYEARMQTQEKELNDFRQQIESDLAEREKTVAVKETLLQDLQLQVEGFPTSLAKAVEEKKNETEIRVKQELQFQMQLANKEMEGKEKLFLQKIEALEAKIREQELQLAKTAKSAEVASLQVKDIAVKAIEGASGRNNYSSYVESTPVPFQGKGGQD